MKKKRILLGLSAFALVGLATVLSSCDGDKKYTVKFVDGQQEITKTEVTFDYSYLNNCATEDTHQYVKDNIENQAGLEKALREVAHDIKSWAEYTEAKSITNF